MSTDQTLLFALFAVVLGLLLWGRVRHDLVAAGGLLVAVLLGLVPEDEAFSGFASPAVLIVALVLIASRAFENSGILGLLTKLVADDRRPAGAHIGIFGGLGAALSAVMNNVAALAMLMPLDVQAARRAGRPPGLTLMPLAFATILGGMVTLIGTPPNIIASAIRAQQIGMPYSMFDFAPVGGAVAVAGVLFVALMGWRLVPVREDRTAEIDPAAFVAELLVPEDAKLVGRAGSDLDQRAEKADVRLVGLIRDGRLRRGGIGALTIRAGDLVVVEGATEAIAAFIKATDLQMVEADEDAPEAEHEAEEAKADGKERPSGPEIVEAVVRGDSFLVGRSAASSGMRPRFGITLLGLERAGYGPQRQIVTRRLAAGDVLLLTGRQAGSRATLEALGLIAVNRVGVAPFSGVDAGLAVALFFGAVAVATAGYLTFPVAIAIAVATYAALGLVPANEFYSQIDWPIVVMLACLLPLGMAFQEVGGTALIAGAVAELTRGYTPVVALVVLMVVTMLLSDVLNNVATMVVTGPVAIELARRLEANPDTFLMGTAIAASCAFLTPIGHQNNTLIMGPGGFRFADYWRLGLPLELVVLLVAVPMLLIVWPL